MCNMTTNIEDAPTGYLMRWRQPGIDDLETTDSRVFHDLDEILDICRRVNLRWKGEVERWPVEFALSPKGKPIREVQDVRGLCGFTHPRRMRRSRSSQRAQGALTT